jgi:hypothetical protein
LVMNLVHHSGTNKSQEAYTCATGPRGLFLDTSCYQSSLSSNHSFFSCLGGEVVKQNKIKIKTIQLTQPFF